MYRKLLIAIDPEDDGEGKRALEAALALLDETGELHLASVYQPDSGGFFPHVTEEAPEEKETRVREKLDLLARKYLPLNRSASLHVVARNSWRWPHSYALTWSYWYPGAAVATGPCEKLPWSM